MMRKFFVSAVAVFVLSVTSLPAQNLFTTMIGMGVSSIEGVSGNDGIVSFEAGVGYEFCINNWFGIEPGAMLATKGGRIKDNDYILSYLDLPVRFNFHLGNNIVLAPGVYFACLVDDDNTTAKSFDCGIRQEIKYVFDSGMSLGLDMTSGLTDVIPCTKSNRNTTAAFIVGFGF